MGPQEAIIQYLKSYSTLSALVSTRIRPDMSKQGTELPAVIVQRVGGAPLYADDGEVGLEEIHFQIDCYGTSRSSTQAVAEAVKDRLSAFSGTTSSVMFQSIFIDDERHFTEQGSNQAEYLYRTAIDIIAWVQS